MARPASLPTQATDHAADHAQTVLEGLPPVLRRRRPHRRSTSFRRPASRCPNRPCRFPSRCMCRTGCFPV